ncbi:SDR family oxidoreductase [Natronoglycomyces albus]|uniref:SDR family oxidoreductase n=1 Tax=Natronoglycomyces albus TaxID=2811108 RepID=A0A895XNK2_9ACTN|nr:SDR family oxidoreductase [Natronoglycomyces albus]QSB06707.1 SDR family oxidoreductase [Natronoglycomyces albus]
MNESALPLSGKVALVAGGTRGASKATALELARSGAFVYATGRSSRTAGRSEMKRPETIEDTHEALNEIGQGEGLRVDHLEPSEVKDLIARIDDQHGRIDILVNGIFGGDAYVQFGKKLWEHDLHGGLRMLRMGIETHAITSHAALPLLIRHSGGMVIELTDGTEEFNRDYRADVGLFYDLVKTAVGRMTKAQAHELKAYDCAAIAVTPGWLRSEAMLDAFGVSEETWTEACERMPHFAISETPRYVARGIAALAADEDRLADSGSVLSSADLARRYGVTDVDGSKPDCWRYLSDGRMESDTADTSGYR